MQTCTNPCRQFAPATKLCTVAFDICGFSLWYLHYVTLLRLECWKNCAPVCIVCSCRSAQIPGDMSPRRQHVVRWRLNICGSSVYDLLDITFLASRIFGLFLGFRKFCTTVSVCVCVSVCTHTHSHTKQVSRTCEPMVAPLIGNRWMNSLKIMAISNILGSNGKNTYPAVFLIWLQKQDSRFWNYNADYFSEIISA